MRESKSFGDILFSTSTYVYVTLFTLFALAPFWIMTAASFTDDLVLRQDGYLPWARR